MIPQGNSHFSSPLELAIKDKKINEVIERIRRFIEEGGSPDQFFKIISSAEVVEIKAKFDEAIKRGEHGLIEFSLRLCFLYFTTRDVDIDITVLARTPGTPSLPVAVRKRIELERLLKVRDRKLAEEILSEDMPGDRELRSIATFVEYQPKNILPECPALFLISRVKATDDICAKICDHIFRVHEKSFTDKIFTHLSPYLKDVYGIKIIARSQSSCYEAYNRLRTLEGIKVVEFKDYIKSEKKSGFVCLKPVVYSSDQVYEIQIQSKVMYDLEIRDTRASHRTYMERRERLRASFGNRYRQCYEYLRKLFERHA